MPLSWLLVGFQSLPLLPTSKLGPSGADSGWVRLCTFQDPVGPSNEFSCKTGSFSHCCNPHRFSLPEVLRLYFPALELWVVQSVLLPSCSPQFICIQMWDCLVLQPPLCLFWSSSWCLATIPLYPCCLSPPFLLVWMNVSSLTPWLSEFHTSDFLAVLCCFVLFCFFGLKLFFFWVYEEAKCTYLCLHLGQISRYGVF